MRLPAGWMQIYQRNEEYVIILGTIARTRLREGTSSVASSNAATRVWNAIDRRRCRAQCWRPCRTAFSRVRYCLDLACVPKSIAL